jgi:hypothetical protein
MMVGFDFGPTVPNLNIPPEIQRRFESINEDYRAARSEYGENMEKIKASKKGKKPKKVKDHPMLELHKELLRNLGKIIAKLPKGGKIQKLLSISKLRFPVPTKGVISVQDIAEDFALKFCDQLFALRGKFKQTQLLSVAVWAQIQVLRRITEGCNVLAKEKRPTEDSQVLLSFLTLVRKKLIEHIQNIFACMDESHRACLALPEEEDVFLVSEQIKGFYELVIHDYTNNVYVVTDAVRYWNDAYRVQLMLSNTNIHLPEVWDRYGKSIYSFRTKSMDDVVESYLVLLESLHRYPEPKETPLHMLVTYMTGPGDLLQVYKLVESCKNAPKYKLQGSARRRILETCRNVAIDIIKNNYAKSVKEANAGNALTKGVADKIVKMGKEYAKLAMETSDGDSRVPFGQIRQMLLQQILEEFNTKNKFWPQAVGMLLQGYFADDISISAEPAFSPLVVEETAELSPVNSVKTPSISVPKKDSEQTTSSAPAVEGSSSPAAIVFGSDFEEDYDEKTHGKVIIEMNETMVNALRNYIDSHRKNLQAAVMLLIEHNFVHDCFVIKTLLHAPAFEDVSGQKGQTLKEWYQVFQQLIKVRGHTIFDKDKERMLKPLSRSLSGFLKAILTHPEYTGHDKMFNLLRDFLEMLHDHPEFLKCPADQLLIRTLFTPLSKEMQPNEVCDAVTKHMPKSFYKGLMDEVKESDSELWSATYQKLLASLKVSEQEMYECGNSVQTFFKNLQKLCKKNEHPFWEQVLQK